MTKKIRFGICIPQFLPIPKMIEQFQFVEALGYDSVWLIDQFYNPLRSNDPLWEAWTLLAAIAAQTTHIRIGTLVTNLIYRNPALVASQALTVDHISNGRLELGLGAGFSPKDHHMTGSEAWEARERISRFQEAVQIVDLMLRNKVTTYEGKYYRVKDAILSPRPIQKPRPPLTLGVTGPVAMKFAAAYADSWNTPDINVIKYSARERISLDQALESCRSQQEVFDEYCVKSGRNPHDIRRSLLVGYVVGIPFTSPSLLDEYLGRYREIGITEFIFYWFPDEYQEILAHRISSLDRQQVEQIATQSIPAWRK